MTNSDLMSPATLSLREREVLTHLATGQTHAAIARCMRLSPHTVDTYLRRIRAKTGATNRVQLLLYALSISSAQTVGTTEDRRATRQVSGAVTR
ncbi:LuxR family transcriptional regulator [Streptomyces fagopyri]|uniref:LuxR family transcriptional regulator n=1 Tax=Streptomyces fagopyri TaxID=2662397 RepID=A0A5Q0LLR2_9ACTN|nr:helix-turn-helix transcriptional regulator [Streptomyces fagopyri]QFZ78053.1 LuxR family transcriptional regulator [Streptomyces fagopyri]